MLDERSNKKIMNDDDEKYPAISDVPPIMMKGCDNEAQRYAYDYVSEEQGRGRICKYMQKSWKWKTTLEETTEEDSDEDYNGEDGQERNTDFLKCQRDHDIFQSHNMQQIRVIFNKELFKTKDSAELFLYTMAQNLPDRALSYEVMFLRGGFENSFALSYWSYEKEFTKELLAMLFAYRLHVDVPYDIELWEISQELSGFTHKENRNKVD
jgi:hypothetical protein